MKLFYIVVDFYPNLKEPEEKKSIACLYHTYQEARQAVAATLKPYKADDGYEVLEYPNFDMAYIVSLHQTPSHMYHLEISEGELDYLIL